MWDLRPYKSGCLLHLRARPNAAQNSVEGCVEGILRLRLKAIPAKGQANDVCVRYLSKLLDLPSSRMEIVRGAHSRDKWVWFKEVDQAVLIKRLEKAFSESM